MHVFESFSHLVQIKLRSLQTQLRSNRTLGSLGNRFSNKDIRLGLNLTHLKKTLLLYIVRSTSQKCHQVAGPSLGKIQPTRTEINSEPDLGQFWFIRFALADMWSWGGPLGAPIWQTAADHHECVWGGPDLSHKYFAIWAYTLWISDMFAIHVWIKWV